MNNRSFIHKQISSIVGRKWGTIVGIHTKEKIAALTFDDGPHPEFTPRLLKILSKHQAHATFFMVGRSARAYPQLVNDASNAGHAIGIHGWDHSSFVKLSLYEQRKQLQACAGVYGSYVSRIFRPPYGHQNIASHLNVRSMGYEVIGWDLDVADWLYHDSISLADELINKLKPGSIILLHDAIHLPEVNVHINRQSTLDAVDSLLSALGSAVKFITVPELLKYGALKRENWYRN